MGTSGTSPWCVCTVYTIMFSIQMCDDFYFYLPIQVHSFNYTNNKKARSKKKNIYLIFFYEMKIYGHTCIVLCVSCDLIFLHFYVFVVVFLAPSSGFEVASLLTFLCSFYRFQYVYSRADIYEKCLQNVLVFMRFDLRQITSSNKTE